MRKIANAAKHRPSNYLELSEIDKKLGILDWDGRKKARAPISSRLVPDANVHTHTHRRPFKRDFEGKTIKRFHRSADNIWRFWFTDGTSFAIQSDLHYGLPVMDICNACVKVNK